MFGFWLIWPNIPNQRFVWLGVTRVTIAPDGLMTSWFNIVIYIHWIKLSMQIAHVLTQVLLDAAAFCWTIWQKVSADLVNSSHNCTFKLGFKKQVEKLINSLNVQCVVLYSSSVLSRFVPFMLSYEILAACTLSMFNLKSYSTEYTY